MGLQVFKTVTCNSASVNNVEALRSLIDRYDVLPGFLLVEGLGGVWRIQMEAQSSESAATPSALKMAELPDSADLRSEFAWLDVISKLHKERGEAGFSDFLVALAPYLTSPLIVQAAVADSEHGFESVKQWTIRPGATKVEIVVLEPLHAEGIDGVE